MSISLDAVVWSGFLGLLLASVWTDIKDLRIPNVLPATLAVLFLIAGLFTPDFNWLSHLGAGALVLGVGVALFAMGKVGGGDVKLLAAVALWVGFAHLLPLVLVMGVCGGGVALLFLVLRRSGIGFLFRG